MIKKQEMSDEKSCLNKAQDDEPIFVLRAKDPAAPNTILAWIQERARLGLNSGIDAKIIEAQGLRNQMIEWRTKYKAPSVLLKFVYMKESGKYYTGGELKISVDDERFKGCIYPKDFGIRCRELKLLPGISGGTWPGPFTVEHNYTELVMP